MTRNSYLMPVLGGLAAVAAIGAIVAAATRDTGPTVEERTTVEAPFTKVEKDQDKVRVQAPFVDIEVPKDRQTDGR